MLDARLFSAPFNELSEGETEILIAGLEVMQGSTGGKLMVWEGVMICQRSGVELCRNF